MNSLSWPFLARFSRWQVCVLVLSVLAGAVVACGQGPIDDGWECFDPATGKLELPANDPSIYDNGHYAADGEYDPCHCFDPGGAAKTCPPNTPGVDYGARDGGTVDAAADAPLPGCKGQCVPEPEPGWFGPVLFSSDAGVTPECPPAAPTVAYQGFAGPDLLPASCGTCSCARPEGTCALPATVTASTDTCEDGGAGAMVSHADPPSGWDGGCTANDPVAAGTDCLTTPCTRSLTIAPLTVTESCAPVPGTMSIPAPFASTVQACVGPLVGTCDVGEVCTAATTVPGFEVCVFAEGDVACPSSSGYSEAHVVYDTSIDTRSCAACTCGAPTGSICMAQLFAFTDDACTPASQLVMDTLDLSAPLCVDIPAGSALGSKSASAPEYTAGACQASGGGPTGSVDPIHPWTFCCVASPATK